MKLRTKLIIMFVSVLVVPFLLCWLCIIAFQRKQDGILKELNNTDETWEAFIGNSIQALNKAVEEEQQNMLLVLEDDPDRFLDKEFQVALESELEKQGAYLIISKNNEIVYSGYENVSEEELRQMLSREKVLSFDDGGIYVTGRINCFLKQHQITFSDGKKGMISILLPTDSLLPQAKGLAWELALMVIGILILLAFFISMYIYCILLKPIKELRKATKAVTEGNLEYQLDVGGSDEIGELCRDFEEMRCRLKEQAEEKLQYDRESKELISNISHDLKTPITSIKGYVEGIMDGVASSPEKQERYIRTIYAKACDMERLIEELTFYSKIDSNKIPYVFAKINVAEYFADCVMDLEDELEAHGIEFQFRNRVDDDTMVIADAEQMKRVINNIVSNSVKYMDKEKQWIHMDIIDAGDFIEIRIADNGSGIGARELPNIFERFYRTDASRNSVKGGSGIGLSIVRKIIEDHGGKVWATSVLGEGTTMHFVLRKYQEERQ